MAVQWGLGGRAWLAEIYEVAGPTQSSRNRAMEGLRGFAVFLTFLVHFHASFSSWLSPNSGLFAFSAGLAAIGCVGVFLFFVLSGYLIYRMVLTGHSDYATFLRRRIQRIYPPFLLVLAIYLVLSGLIPLESKIPTGWANGVFYIAQNALLLPGIFPIRPMVSVAWSLSYEVFYYLVIPLFAAVLVLRRWKRSSRVMLFIAIAGATMVGSYFFPFRLVTLVMFIPGILICEIVQAVGAGWKTKTTGDFFVLLGTAVALAMVCLFSEPRKIKLLSADAAFWVILLTLFVALGALTLAAIYSNGPVGRLLSWTPLRWLGNMSYSYYLIHGLTLKALCFALTRAIPPLQPLPIVWWVMFPVSFAVAWIVSTGLFLWVEKRFSLVPSSSRALGAVSPGPTGAFAAIIPTPDCSAAPEPYSRTDRAGQQRLTVSAHPS